MSDIQRPDSRPVAWDTRELRLVEHHTGANHGWDIMVDGDRLGCVYGPDHGLPRLVIARVKHWGPPAGTLIVNGQPLESEMTLWIVSPSGSPEAAE